MKRIYHLPINAFVNRPRGYVLHRPQSFYYTTNAKNFVTALTIKRKGQPNPDTNFSYSYDADNRLIQRLNESTPQSPTQYSYDDVGNLLTVIRRGSPIEVLFSASYNSVNQIVNANGVPFQYDAAGQLVDDGNYSYTWNAAHRLASVTNKLTFATTQFSYDGLGRRISIQTASGTAYYLWCGKSQCQKGSSLGALPATRYFPQGEIQGTGIGFNTKLFYARDRLGSIRNLVDTTGTVQADYAFDPWGNVTNKTGTAEASFGFAGMFVDHGTGLNLTLYRAYNPAQYRWLSRDPLGEAADINLYRYVFDNPLNAVDPYGLYSFREFLEDIEEPIAGFGDTITFGLTKWIRGQWNQALDMPDTVNYCSTSYKAGSYAAMIYSFAIGGVGGIRAAGTAGRSIEFSHWIPSRYGGPRTIWNGNYVSTAKHAMSDPYRHRFMPRTWKADNPMPSRAMQQWSRIPNAAKGTASGAAYGAAANAAARGCTCPQ